MAGLLQREAPAGSETGELRRAPAATAGPEAAAGPEAVAGPEETAGPERRGRASSLGRTLRRGEMARLVNLRDWSVSPLGPMEDWSKELVSAVKLVQAYPTPACLFWGMDATMIFNDEYRDEVLGEKLAASLGEPAREVWAGIWNTVGSQIEGAYQREETTSAARILIPMDRGGQMQDRYWDYVLLPLYEGERVAGVLNTCVDVTPLVEARRERDVAAERLKQVFDITSDGILCVDRDWTVSFLNESGLRMLEPSGAIVGKNLWASFPALLARGAPYGVAYRRAMEERIGSTFDAYYPEPLNIWVHLEVCSAADGIVVFFRDVSRERREADMMRTNDRLISVGRLAASLAHEINSPLESVTNLLYLARLDAEKAEQVEVLDEAERELRRIRVIAEQTLRFHKYSSVPLRMGGAALFETVISLYRGKCKDSSVVVSTRWRGDGTVSCFEGEIRQVLANLLANAIDAMPVGGRLLLRSREGTDWKTGRSGLTLTVADTGSGMDAATQARVLEAFFTTKGTAGTGLGLWISAEIVARHHSRLHIRSSRMTRHCGTVISLFLPFGSRPEAGAQMA